MKFLNLKTKKLIQLRNLKSNYKSLKLQSKVQLWIDRNINRLHVQSKRQGSYNSLVKIQKNTKNVMSFISSDKVEV